MNILQVIPVFNPPELYGGSQQVVYQISKELVERGHNITIYTSDIKRSNLRERVNEHVEVVDGIKIVHFRTLSSYLSKKLRLMITPTMKTALLREGREFDLIHVHELRGYQHVVVYQCAKKLEVPYVIHGHGILSMQRVRFRTRGKGLGKMLYDVVLGDRLLKNAAKAIAVSEVEAREFEQISISKEKIAIVPNGIDIPKRKNLPPKYSFKKKLGVEQEKKVILFLGRINRLKGIDFLIEAFVYMIKSMKNDDVILVIAGPDDGYLNEVKKLVNQYAIGGSVFFSGPLFGIRKTEAYVDASVVASLDSLKEVVFLLVPLEAAASGAPVIVTKSNYIARLVEEGGFGFSVEYGNVPELVTKLEEVLYDENLQKQMGLKGRNFVSENFDWKNIVDRIEKVYKDVVKTRTHVLTEKL